MSTVSIVYFSGSGHTARMAEAVASGARSVPGATVELLPVKGGDIHEGRFRNPGLLEALDRSDAVIFGSPTYMGGPAAQFKAFADATGGRWFEGRWRDKVAAGFTVSMGLNGDKLSTLHYFFTLAMQHGMVWVGLPDLPGGDDGVNRLGSHAGAMGQAGQEPPEVAPNEADLRTGSRLGARVAAAAGRWRAG